MSRERAVMNQPSPLREWAGYGLPNLFKYVKKENKNDQAPPPGFKNTKIGNCVRIVIIGRPGTGKSHSAAAFIALQGFERLYLYSKTLDRDPIWKTLLSKVKGEQLGGKGSDLSEVPALDEFDPEVRNVVVLDDFALAKNADKAIELFTNGRKSNITVLWLTQNFFRGCDQKIRTSIDYCFLFKLGSIMSVKRILKEFPLSDIPEEKLLEFYKFCTDKPGCFMLIDTLAPADSHLRVRLNFGVQKIEPPKLARIKEADEGEQNEEE